MPKRSNATVRTWWPSIRLLVLMISLGVITGTLALIGVLLFSEDALLPLPPAVSSLSLKDTLYLRAFLRWNASSLVEPSAKNDGVFLVEEGQGATAVCENLQAEGFVPDAKTVCAYLQYTGGDRSISAGYYLIHAGQNPQAIADNLSTGSDMVRTVTVFPGWRIEEVALAFASSKTGISPSDVLATLFQRPGAGSVLDLTYTEIPASLPLEGFLLPGSYKVMPGENAAAVVERMVFAFQQSVPEEWKQAYAAQGFSFFQAVTIASIVQREAMQEDEMPIIASVYINRLAQGMKLDADPTLQYALGLQPSRGGWWANPLYDSDFSLDSPFNTYIHPGLPPAPICNPGLAALRAVAYPAATNYFYFRAACDGSGRHNFAATYEEQLRNACSE